MGTLQRGATRMITWPVELQDEINTSYSEQLYGSPGRVPPLTSLELLWVPLLSPGARRSLVASGAIKCGWHPAAPERSLSVTPIEFVELQAAAVWVSQRKAPAAALDDEWVEVAHCSYDNFYEGTEARRSPMWFLLSPGSGISMNVGHTLLIDDRRFSSKTAARLHRALVRGDFRYANQLFLNISDAEERPEEVDCWLRKRPQRAACFSALDRYDTIQFPNWQPRKTNKPKTEIVSLKWGLEIHFASSHLNSGRLLCGRAPTLRLCHPTDAAARMQGPSCLRNVRSLPSKIQIFESINCTAPRPYDASYDRRSDAEAAALRKKYGLSAEVLLEAEDLVDNMIKRHIHLRQVHVPILSAWRRQSCTSLTPAGRACTCIACTL